MGKMDMDKMKGNLEGAQHFAKKHIKETFAAAGILLAALSSWGGFFIGTLGWGILFLTLGALVALFLPKEVEKVFEKIGSLGQNSTSKLALEIGKLALALFLPFVYYAFLGMRLGLSYPHASSN